MALAGVLANKLRSGLTILGVIVGVTTVVGMLAVVQGMNASVAGMIEEMGTGSFLISKFAMGNLSTAEYLKQRRYPDITEDDAMELSRSSSWIKEASASVTTVHEIHAGRLEADNVPVKGLSSTFAEITQMELARGRVFTDQENVRRKNVCIIGPSVAKELFPGLDPLNRFLSIDRHRFRVVGVMAERGKMFGQDLDSFVLIPHGSYRKAFGRGFHAVLIVQANDANAVPAAIDDAIGILRRRRGLRTADENNFFIITQEAMITSYEQMTGAIYAVMIGVAGISLLVGGIGIMNIMLVTVTERTREIGLRKAVGACRMHLMLQFISEAAGLSSVGGVLGLLLGAGLAALVRGATPIPARVIGWSLPMAFLFSIAVGVTAGLFPALKAARLHPVDALRQE